MKLDGVTKTTTCSNDTAHKAHPVQRCPPPRFAFISTSGRTPNIDSYEIFEPKKTWRQKILEIFQTLKMKIFWWWQWWYWWSRTIYFIFNVWKNPCQILFQTIFDFVRQTIVWKGYLLTARVLMMMMMTTQGPNSTSFPYSNISKTLEKLMRTIKRADITFDDDELGSFTMIMMMMLMRMRMRMICIMSNKIDILKIRTMISTVSLFIHVSWVLCFCLSLCQNQTMWQNFAGNICRGDYNLRKLKTTTGPIS